MEEAKSVQEVAKATGKGIDAGRELGGFFNKVLGDGLIELGGMLHDWAKIYRFENMMRLQDRVEKIIAQRNIEGKTIPIPTRIGIPILQNASLEDDEIIQGMWATLIVNSLDPDTRLNPSKLFVSILSELEPLDTGVLHILDEHKPHSLPIFSGGNLEFIRTELNIEERELQLSLHNLYRLGLITDMRLGTMDGLDYVTSGLRVDDPSANYVLTTLGVELVAVCMKPSMESDEESR